MLLGPEIRADSVRIKIIEQILGFDYLLFLTKLGPLEQYFLEL